jgi:hypothetical protein
VWITGVKAHQFFTERLFHLENYSGFPGNTQQHLFPGCGMDHHFTVVFLEIDIGIALEVPT